MPKIVDHEQYRRDLLGKGFHLFAQVGYSAITMRQLAEGLGVSTGTLYHYFPSKQAIFEQMMLDRMERNLREFSADIVAKTSLRDKIIALFHCLQQEEHDVTDELILYVEYYKHQQREGNVENLIAEIYSRIEREAIYLLGTDDPSIIQFLASIIDGLLLAHIYGRKIDWKSQAELISSMLETHLQSPPHSP